MRALDPKQATCLIAAVQLGTIRGAAEYLGVEPSTISRQIAALETELAVTLIERGRSGVRPTEEGELLIGFLRRQENELEAMLSDFDALRGMQRGAISIAVGEGFVGDLLDAALAPFSQQYPGISFRLNVGSSEQVLHEVLTDRVHLGLAYNAAPDRQIKVLARARQPLMLLAAPDSAPAALPEPVTAAALAGLPCAILSRSYGIGAMLGRAESRHGLRFRALVETGSIAVLKNFVRSGMGVSFLPEFVVVREIRDGQIVAKPIALPEFNRGEAQLLVRQGRRLPDAANRLLTHLQRNMAAYASGSLLHSAQR